MSEPTPSFTVTGEWLRDMRRPMVYAWTRGGETLYVGLASRGLCRPLGHHHKLVTDAIKADDALDIYSCETVAEAVALEKQLIEHFQPVLNGKYSQYGKRDDYPTPRQLSHLDLIGEFERLQRAMKRIAGGLVGDPQAVAEEALGR